ncbi:uncharacterized protein FFB20_02682 [Fusarium fujikuroi]|nr:uncharacterized protein FFB20_02682 [Fusarium fujikuroi]SCO33721.1 uncharacterized protein FFNC_03398 [Fusarium fujikuroi]
MTALEDYLGKATQGTSGIPINYYLKDIDQKMLAQMWAAKYYPGEFMAINEGLWRKVHTKGFDAVIWKFNPITIQRPCPFYAPCPAGPGAKRLLAYIRIEAKNKEHQSLFQDDLKKDFFVSLFALIVLGSQQEIGLERLRKCKLQSHLEALLSSNSDCIVLPRESESELSAWQNLEEEFLKRTNDWKPNFMEGLPKIPVRSESGDIDTVQLSKEWQGWHDVLPQMGILDTASKHGGKPV